MVKQLVFLSILIFVSNAYTMNLHLKTEIKTNSNSKYNPKMGCTISLRKRKAQDKVSAISFISEMQNSLGKYKQCKRIILNIFFYFLKF